MATSGQIWSKGREPSNVHNFGVIFMDTHTGGKRIVWAQSLDQRWYHMMRLVKQTAAELPGGP